MADFKWLSDDVLMNRFWELVLESAGEDVTIETATALREFYLEGERRGLMSDLMSFTKTEDDYVDELIDSVLIEYVDNKFDESDHK